LPKRGVNVHENEIMRAYKTVNDGLIEPVSFIVPRRAEVFQGDIYPPATGLKAAVSSSEWFDGKTGMPTKISLESVYEGKEPEELASDYKPRKMEPVVTSPPPTKTEAPKPEPEVTRAPPPEMKDNKTSIAAMASKFADKSDDEVRSDDDASSFEEVPKPVERPAAVTATRKEEKTREPEIKSEPRAPSPTKATTTYRPSGPTRTDSSSALWSKGQESATSPSTTSAPAATTAAPTASGAAEGLRGSLTDLKEQNNRMLSLLEQQSRVLGRQMDQIMFLTEEVEKLKGKLGDSNAADADNGANTELEEKIRRLELELEEARSA